MTHLLRAAATLAALGACSGWSPADARAQAAAATAAFSADVVIERHQLDASGAVARRMPTVRYRLTHHAGGDDPLTEIRFQATPPFPGRGPLQDPSGGYRVVVSERQGIRVFDAHGRLVQAAEAPAPAVVPAPAARARRLPDPALPRAADGRRQELRAKYGSPAGRHDGRDRFVHVDADIVEELLVDADTALPLEVRRLRQGRVVFRSSVSYGTLPDGRYYRQVQRDESMADTDAGTREVTVTTITPVAGGGR